MLTGTFTPSAFAPTFSSALHFNQPTTPVTIRFSNSTGIPQIPDFDANSNPRGIGIRFHLGGRSHTDIIAHSTSFFPTRTGEGFLELLGAIGASATATEKPTPIEKFLGANPSALAFVSDPKPAPASFATEKFFGVNAFKFTNYEGKTNYARYKITPDAGYKEADQQTLTEKSAETNYLMNEIKERVGTKGEKVGFKILVQIAEEGDVTDDATVHWPDERKVEELGGFVLDALVEDSEKEQKYVIFDPIPRVEGIEASADPLLNVRAGVYLISGKERRAA
ncbi:catalase related subgroup domain-containing protein [Aulographum hederae CBS 113979]|uniref:Catalase related subgroup domain-containing protein n=1 Tax=Aulographum hederae CBS 113979 TaxID=1176131 RepID=A0A6G1GM39_9PEZI|nr:catalase related subgroup domain-containing protein [Aulographum hederae CBS 113979]